MQVSAIDSFNAKKRRKGNIVRGWNEHIKEAHSDAKLKFYIWVLYGKPKEGNIYDDMCLSRKIFKSRLKWCQDNQDQITMDKIAKFRSNKDFKSFWKSTKKLNVQPCLPATIGESNSPQDIAEMFRNHFKVSPQINSDDSVTNTERCLGDADASIRFTAKDVCNAIKRMKRGKSPGHDSLSVEHLQYAGVHLPRVLAMFFTLCVRHTYLPRDMMRTVVVPIVKNRTGDISDKGNYRPISLATILAKVLDSLLDSHLEVHLNLHEAQFGFRQGVSTESAIASLKHTVKYYTDRKTDVYACFLDLSKAFDLVSYGILWRKLTDAGMPVELVAIFRYWYGNQINCVKWGETLSSPYRLKCGVRQGGLTSPKLFNLYMNSLIEELSGINAGCYVDGVCVNNISYADDMALLSPSINALRRLLKVCESYAERHGLLYNSKKSEFLVFRSGNKSPVTVPPVSLNGYALKRVTQFKYLGHIVTETQKDDLDIERERRALAVRGNMLARRFARCSRQVKITLFKAYCQTLYTGSLWTNYTQRAYNALRVQFNNIFRMLLGLPRFCSASGMFAEARADGFHAIMRKRAASLLARLRGSPNSILAAVAVRCDGPLLKHWPALLGGVRTYADKF